MGKDTKSSVVVKNDDKTKSQARVKNREVEREDSDEFDGLHAMDTGSSGGGVSSTSSGQQLPELLNLGASSAGAMSAATAGLSTGTMFAASTSASSAGMQSASGLGLGSGGLAASPFTAGSPQEAVSSGPTPHPQHCHATCLLGAPLIGLLEY